MERKIKKNSKRKRRMKVVRTRETESKIISTRRGINKKTKRRMEFYRVYVWENVEM